MSELQCPSSHGIPEFLVKTKVKDKCKILEYIYSFFVMITEILCHVLSGTVGLLRMRNDFFFRNFHFSMLSEAITVIIQLRERIYLKAQINLNYNNSVYFHI